MKKVIRARKKEGHKDVRLKFTEEERKWNKEFSTELEIKRKLDKESEAKVVEMLKKLKKKE